MVRYMTTNKSDGYKPKFVWDWRETGWKRDSAVVGFDTLARLGDVIRYA